MYSLIVEYKPGEVEQQGVNIAAYRVEGDVLVLHYKDRSIQFWNTKNALSYTLSWED